MKTKFYLIVLILFSFVTLAFSQDQMSMFDDGRSGGGGGLPRSNPIGFSAVIEDGEYINVVFPSNTGTYDVSIENEFGTKVYSRSVITASTNKLFISISDLPEDSYKIRFINKQQGESIFAKFSIE